MTVRNGILFTCRVGDRVGFDALDDAPGRPGWLVARGYVTGTVTAFCPDAGLPALVEVTTADGAVWEVAERDLEDLA